MGNTMTKEPKKSPFHRLLARFQLCPQKPEKWSKSKKENLPPPKPPLRNQSKSQDDVTENETGWTEISLTVAESPPSKMVLNDESLSIPIPPPRKHKIKQQEIKEKHINMQNAKRIDTLQTSEEARKPVEEPLIVAKKVIEHVCDGTHEHVRNVVNGKIVDQIVSIDRTKRAALSKNASSLSLPSYEELKKKEDKSNLSPKKSSKKSLESSSSGEKKTKSNSAAEKLESYMIRCKSFGSILPNTKPEKNKMTENAWDKGSDDSWAGLEDWDRQVIEDDTSGQQHQPRGLNLNDIDQFAASINKAQHSTPNQNSKIIQGKTDSNSKSYTKDKTENTTTDEQTHSFKNLSQNYPFKSRPDNSVFENDRFFTSEFLKNEARSSELTSPQIKKLAPLATFDSDKEIDQLLQGKKTVVFALDKHTDTKNSTKQFKSVDESKRKDADKIPLPIKQLAAVNIAIDDTTSKFPSSKETNLPNDNVLVETNRDSTDNDTPVVIPRRKSNTGHSNLLKFINRSSLKSPEADNFYTKAKQIEQTDEVLEAQIVPEIRELEDSWQKLVQRDNDQELSSLLELESTVSTATSTNSDARTSSNTLTMH